MKKIILIMFVIFTVSTSVIAFKNHVQQVTKASTSATYKDKKKKNDSNSGDYNKGKNNTGNFNKGDNNSGNHNKGNNNDGEFNKGNNNKGNNNKGDGNSGNFNNGDENSGNYNIGNNNSGNVNSGDYNSGNFNVGNDNIGDYNIGYSNAGMFNVSSNARGCFNNIDFKKENEEVYIFNKKCDHTLEELNDIVQRVFHYDTKEQKFMVSIDKKIAKLLNNNEYCILNTFDSFTFKYNMDLIGNSYKNQYRFKKAFKELHKILSKSDPNLDNNIRKLPNFSPDLFEKITGIKI